MTFQEQKNKFRTELKEIYSTSEIDSFFFWLLEEKLNFSKKDYFLKTDIILEEAELSYFNDALNQLKEEKPIQYILGKAEFFDLHFELNQHTLIPRPETEELVRWIIDEQKHKKEVEISILDIGSGSGCIPISLASYFTKSTVMSMDISADALKVATKNALSNKVSVNFLREDFLQREALDFHVDILVSNPPYVKENEKHLMQKNVLSYEPSLALFVEDKDPLIFYKHLFRLAKQHSISVTYVEINEFLHQEMEALALEFTPKSFELKKDMFGKYRMMKICF